jgi:hypothetical protein
VVTNNPVQSPGKAIDLAAPGTDVLSLCPNLDTASTSCSMGAYLTGTSMATANVSGLVALYIAANGRAHNADDVHRIRQALIDNGLPQSQWRSAPNTGDPDGNPEPLAIASLAWIPPVTITNAAMTPQGFQLSFNAIPGCDYTFQSSSSLNTSNQWTDLLTTNLSAFNYTLISDRSNYSGGIVGEKLTILTVSDTNPPPAQCFYRVARQPAP